MAPTRKEIEYEEALSTVRSQCESALERIRRHQFIVQANAGDLSRHQAERWIFLAGRESRSFPSILENMINGMDAGAVRDALERNLADEYGNGDPSEAHFQHYLQLLDELGVSRQRFTDYSEGVGIRLALELADSVSHSPQLGVALGYMLVNEGMTQITYGGVYAALRRYWPNLRSRFFEIHTQVDERHQGELYEVIGSLDAAAFEWVRYGIDIGERGMAVLLDEALGLFDRARAA